jgi:hypothetical protein
VSEKSKEIKGKLTQNWEAAAVEREAVEQII